MKRIEDPRQRENVIVPFTPGPRDAGALLAHFDIIIGITPPDRAR